MGAGVILRFKRSVNPPGDPMKSNRFLSALILIIAFTVLSMTQALAQQLATITGSVTDSTGTAIPGVQVSIKSASTGMTYNTVTNGAGTYTISDVKPGPGYIVTLTHSGFKTVSISGVYMNVAATRTQNAKMPIGSTIQTVMVSAASQNVTLDTTDASLGNNFQVQFLQQLPVANRDSPSVLFSQQPGVTSGGTSSESGATTGSRIDQDRVTLDGLDVNDMATGEFGAIIANAPVDSVQEFRGVVAGDQANAMAGGGGHFQLVTRGGTNGFHGDLNEYHRDTDLEANDWFSNNAGVPRSPLVRNQFGGDIGGPIIKNRLFFYFDYNGRRDTLSNVETRIVPRDSFRNGTLNYFNSNGTEESLSSAQVAALDPKGIGFNPALLKLFNSRYPHANDLSAGDGLNTAGFRFNAPFPYKENDYVGRIDWTMNSKMKWFAVAHVTRTNGTESAIQFPGDPETSPYIDNSYSWVVGNTWAINDHMVNQAYWGETVADLGFPNTYNPTGANQFTTFGGISGGGALISSPYASAINAQGRTYPIPVVQDNFTWVRGNHVIAVGGNFKWPSPKDYTILNYNTPTIGLGGNTSELNSSLRPSDIGSGSATSLYDEAFALALAPYTALNATYNYNSSLKAFPQGSGLTHHYHYYEWSLHAGDVWRITHTLTLNYGVRWQVFTDPYDVNGLESVQNFTFDKYFYDRVAQSNAGLYGNTAVPFIQYTLGGKANHAPGYFQTNFHDIAPNFGFAWNPEKLPDTVLNGSAGIIYDQTVINAVQYQQSQFSYLFQASAPDPLGTLGDASGALSTDPRFSGFSSVPAPLPAPAISTPYLPYVSGTGANAVPNGLANNTFNEIINPKLSTPYSIMFNFGMEQKFPKGFILKMSYVGRFGRHLLAQADANQLIDFPDKRSSQMMSAAFTDVEKELRAGDDSKNLPAEPWFEDLVAAATGTTPGAFGQDRNYPNTTSLLATALYTYFYRGDMADTVQQAAGVLPANVGMGSQFSEDTFYTNRGFSSYNGMLVTLHKNLSNGLQFDLNYTWSHSIDNVSLIANQAATGGYGFICDVLRPRECRGNSDFDVSNSLNGNFIYSLPFGREAAIGTQAPIWLNEMIGGWTVSGLPSWHTGYPFNIRSSAYVAGYSNDAPAVLIGSTGGLKIHIHGGNGKPLEAFASPQKALSDYTGPVGFTIGSRNNLRGPNYFNLDLGLGKTFPIRRNYRFNFRADAFNALNHPNFETPSLGNYQSLNETDQSDITTSSTTFGILPEQTVNDARVLQVALRLEF